MSAESGAPRAGVHGHRSSTQVWAILVGLLVVSVLGPLFGHPGVTFVTAFGIAVVKAFLVAKHFMHINLERKWITYLLVTMLALMLVMVGGVAPDVMKHEGQQWENDAAKQAVEAGHKAATATTEKGESHR